MVKHYKGEPSKFIIKYVNGKQKKKGYGISFYYLKFNTSIIAIPTTTIDSHFIYNEITKNFQTISLQGHFTYKIKNPEKMDTLLNFQIDPETGMYVSEDPEKLELRIKNVVQMATRAIIKKVDLEDALALTTTLADTLINEVRDAELLNEMGIEILSITFNAIRPTPEIAEALEAEYRENLQKQADESIFARRAAAVEQEQKIKENELNTDISLEKKREQLVELNGKNILAEAEFRAEAKTKELETYKSSDPQMLMALSFLELFGNPSKIGNFTVTSEILAQLLNADTKN
ncbi:MAG: SPFH domain-containing protein [Candidatus Heimdallarchaeota archaeon]|nr:SPFH domain-containing protein [Candidatus Heimdallarchaeota archaeon]